MTTAQGFTSEVVQGDAFQHRLVWSTVKKPSEILHVYIEGDGRPFVRPNRVARDPTPARSVMLKLMGEDPQNAVFVGRPCYYLRNPEHCEPQYWTTARYSKRVVDSMAVAIEKAWQRQNQPSLVVIGHSGGGALAVLLADELPQIETVITLSGNLDPASWTRHHGYSPLVASLSPLDVYLSSETNELHLLAGADDVVPTHVVDRYIQDQARQRANFLACKVSGVGGAIPRCTHNGCWQRRWREFISHVSSNFSLHSACEVMRSG